MITYISYIRVSTQRQGRSGLGLEAQRHTNTQFAAQQGATILHEYIEVDSGKNDARAVLLEAQAHAKREGASVLVARLDRLSRDVAFIANLMKDKVKFVVAELGPDVDNFMLHIYAAVAQKERERISTNTIAALAAAKARGVKLGSGNPRAGGAARRAKAKRYNAKAFVMARDWRDQGMTLEQIASELSTRGVTLAQGGTQWTATQVSRVLNM